ncbi:MAG: hypothetical protein COU07_01620 [Candidatus Harrisonbacteria bacterium CG10_big_fil_rev_8_21_14_0_10_40_38]|uniref:Type II secretion system protein GspG C-terminal domain-containing protein n=1 Tax=Candidatus Harrisonbacteria bacterium CG10_big_fil_rev_8_21_14_0_10_40_38 TaxID=1974583 RepID=A0A2H0UV87_9BACT|nr:MAG: hypothetical protein COU07_01620 [Candidatus Harrisonbacteria bacterium CG10_big_fil_rev_8_21_14_0_10_40_38]
MTKRKGFTLIELLIVIAIIGILAAALLVSLGGARQAGRDARRIGDVRQVQSALELYFNKCGHYPGGAACIDAGNPTPGAYTDPNDWTVLTSAITGASVGVSNLPKDPNSTDRNYQYGVDTSPGIGRQKYTIGAWLESDNQALKDDIDGTSNGVLCGATPETNPNWYYCVSL